MDIPSASAVPARVEQVRDLASQPVRQAKERRDRHVYPAGLDRLNMLGVKLGPDGQGFLGQVLRSS